MMRETYLYNRSMQIVKIKSPKSPSHPAEAGYTPPLLPKLSDAAGGGEEHLYLLILYQCTIWEKLLLFLPRCLKPPTHSQLFCSLFVNSECCSHYEQHITAWFMIASLGQPHCHRIQVKFIQACSRISLTGYAHRDCERMLLKWILFTVFLTYCHGCLSESSRFSEGRQNIAYVLC